MLYTLGHQPSLNTVKQLRQLDVGYKVQKNYFQPSGRAVAAPSCLGTACTASAAFFLSIMHGYIFTIINNYCLNFPHYFKHMRYSFLRHWSGHGLSGSAGALPWPHMEMKLLLPSLVPRPETAGLGTRLICT